MRWGWLLLAHVACVAQVDFGRDIAPILRARCLACHGPARQQNGLRLDSREAALRGGYSGPAIQPGNSAGSRLIRLVSGLEKERLMPLGGPALSSAQIALLRVWIDQGVVWPEELRPPSSAEEAASKTAHWAFSAPRRPPVPATRNRAWVRNPIDAFVLARLENEGIAPSPEAERRTLLRRVFLDVIGLPPSPEQTEAFLADSRPDAYERLIDELLASPHYGEKIARHWLDLARYADSDGYETDQLRPYAWRYRDWVIDAFNRDLPYDQSTIQQIAGDLLPNAHMREKMATGFHRNTLSNREGGADLEEYRIEQVVDRVATTGATWLGLTLGCARCHDHKYDPISQKEFFQLYAFFNSADEVNISAPVPGEFGTYLRTRPQYEARRRELLCDVEKEIERLQAEWEKKTRQAHFNPGKDHRWDRSVELLGLTWGGNLGWGQLEGLSILLTEPAGRAHRQRQRLQNYFLQRGSVVDPERFKKLRLAGLSKEIEKLETAYPAPSEAPVIVERPTPRATHIHLRGDFRNPGIEVQPGTPAALPADPQPSRLTLARWLVAAENPLVARVAVNRVWQELFGRGIVSTSDDFGLQGSKPSPAELLDWLAVEFRERGWSLKKLHKLILSSATYRQSSNARREIETLDSENVLLARQARLRLPAELIRDSALAVSGLLAATIGGPSVRPPQPASVSKEGYDNPWVESTGADRYRRGIYTWLQRTTPYAQMVTFDAADVNRSCSRRERSNTPLQALTLLNDPVFFEAAQGLAARILSESSGAVEERIDYGFRLALARPPEPRELKRLLKYVDEQREQDAAWTGLASILLNLDEFITRE